MISMRANRWALANNRPPLAAGGGGASETTLVASAGALALTPQPATLTYDPAVAAAAGSLTLTPQPATLTYTPAPWTPASLPNLQLWLANSSLAAIGDAQPIATWPDSSGLGRDAVQATATSRPTARLTGETWEAFFDGVDDYLQSTFTAIAQPTTFWVVGKLLTNSGSRNFVDGSSGARQSIYRRSSGNWYYYAGTERDSTVLADLDPHGFVGIFNGVGSSLRVDGAVVVTGLTTGTLSIANAFIGTSTPAAGMVHGVIYDVGLCSSILAGDDLANLETYLATLVP